jgi:cleavage and polyadenylation specificity factor subunit 3
MSLSLRFLGGTNEIGANSCHLQSGRFGLTIDAGIHPRRNDLTAFPLLKALSEEGTNLTFDAMILTHAHTDHIGALPYMLKQYPHRRLLATRATRDLATLMLTDNAKLVAKKRFTDVPSEDLEWFNKDFVRFFDHSCEGYLFGEEVDVESFDSTTKARVTFHPAGHILGASGVMIDITNADDISAFDTETNKSIDYSVFHTGDVCFASQSLIPSADFPRRHVDVLICESTNAATDQLPSRAEETKRFASFINRILSENGSVMIPAFSLGRTQETLTLLYQLMRRGTIPHVPIFTGGIARKVSRLYDVYNYSVPRVLPGFEMTDIPQMQYDYERLLTGDYFKESSIVICGSGMLDEGTTSYRLALEWVKHPNFGIAFVGYCDPSAPGYSLIHSPLSKEFRLGTKNVSRSCRVEQFRFSAHADRDSLVEFILDCTPNHVFLVHGDPSATERLGAEIKTRRPITKVYLPTTGRHYRIQ